MYISVLGGGGGVVSTHRLIDDTLIQLKFVGWLSRAIKLKIFCLSTVKVASI